MSFVRHHIQQMARTININIPKKIGFVNTNIIDNYQRFQDATIDFCKQHRLKKNQNLSQQERFPLFKKLMSLLMMSVYAGATYKKLNNNEVLPTLSALIDPKPTTTTATTRDQETNDKNNTDDDANKYTESADNIDNVNNPGNGKHKEREKRRRATFSERAVIEYENRLRNYSAPEKIFRYFATICLVSEKGTEIVMTPADFLRSIYPGKKQPRRLGLDRFRRIDRNDIESLDFQLSEDSVFLKLGFNGLISYPDYLFLMTLLTTSSRHFEIAFKMFDANGDGVLSADEFLGVAALARQSATFAATGQDLYRKGITNSLLRYFFGNELKGKLSISEFLKFQENLKKEIITLEFESKPCDERGYISEGDFAELLIAYADYNIKQKEEKLRRVRKRFKRSERGMSIRDYLNFWDLLYQLHDIEMALSFYHFVGASIDRETLHHVAKAVAKVDLSQNVVEVAFILFDDNNDDHLSKSEFVDVLKRRLHRGMQFKRGTNFKQIMAALKKCALERRSYDF